MCVAVRCSVLQCVAPWCSKICKRLQRPALPADPSSLEILYPPSTLVSAMSTNRWVCVYACACVCVCVCMCASVLRRAQSGSGCSSIRVWPCCRTRKQRYTPRNPAITLHTSSIAHPNASPHVHARRHTDMHPNTHRRIQTHTDNHQAGKGLQSAVQ